MQRRRESTEHADRAVGQSGGGSTRTGTSSRSSSGANREHLDEAPFIEAIHRTRQGGEDVGAGCAHERRVRSPVVVLVEERPEMDVEVVQRAERAGEVQASLPERAPEALHLPARRCVVRTRVHGKPPTSDV